VIALGEATYGGDKKAAARARDRIRAVDERIQQEYEKQRRVVQEASRGIDYERGLVAPTQVMVESESEEEETS
jgi:hypothetical protein